MILHHDDIVAWRERVDAAGDPGPWDAQQVTGDSEYVDYQYRLWQPHRIEAQRYRPWWWWPHGHLVVARLVLGAEEMAQEPISESYLLDAAERVAVDQWCPVLLGIAPAASAPVPW
jgi:hypothetical protein